MLSMLLPRKCIGCDLISNVKNRDLCSYCNAFLPWLEDSPHYSPFRYEPPFSKIIHQLKFGGRIEHSKLLGNLLAEYLTSKYKTYSFPEIIIPVPLHTKRTKTRGYNQAAEIAKVVGGVLGIQVDTTSCKKIKYTSAQATLNKDERLRNLSGAFICSGINAQHVAVLDDVVTTGSTVRAVSNVLYKSGVELVEVWSVCRG